MNSVGHIEYVVCITLLNIKMEKEFIPYEQALALKELGFDEECLMYWNDYGKQAVSRFQLLNKINSWSMNYIEAPTFSQVFRWFRDKKISDSCVCRYQSRDGGVYYYYVINHDFGIEETKHFQEGFYTYEEAELACLDKLIEIVESKSEEK